MKLLNCLACQDIVRMFEEERACKCGKSKGRYENARRVTYSGPSRLFGMNSLDYHRVEPGKEFAWFLVEGPNAKKTD